VSTTTYTDVISILVTATAFVEVDCPWCGQTISGEAAECGGEGEGICDGAAYALDLLDGRNPQWESEGSPPTTRECLLIAEVFNHYVPRNES